MSAKPFCAKRFVETLLKEGDLTPCDETISELKDIPTFYDQQKFKRAQSFFQKHYAALTLGKLIGIFFGLTEPKLNEILQSTKKSSSPATAYKRHKTALKYLIYWYESEFYYLSDSWKSLQKIRTRHNYESKCAFDKFQYRITQKDMVLGQLSFIACAVLVPEKIGIYNASHTDMLAFIHYWRNIGCILGIEDRFNICRDSVEDTKEICKEIIKRCYAPTFAKRVLDEDFVKMGKALINGLRSIVPVLEYNGFITITKNIIFDIEIIDNSCDEKYFKCYSLIIYYMRYRVVRTIINWTYRLMFCIDEHYPNIFHKLK